MVADTVALAVQLIFLGKTLIAGGNALGFLLRLAVDIELQPVFWMAVLVSSLNGASLDTR